MDKRIKKIIDDISDEFEITNKEKFDLRIKMLIEYKDELEYKQSFAYA